MRIEARAAGSPRPRLAAVVAMGGLLLAACVDPAPPCPVSSCPSGVCDPETGACLEAPELSITAGPDDVTRQTRAEFTFGCEAGAACTYTCSMGGEPPASCTSPRAVEGLLDGRHVFTVLAVGPSGVTSAPATWTWTVDTVPPIVTDLTGPPAHTHTTEAEVAFGCDKTGCTFTCALDGGPAEACAPGARFEDLPDGDRVLVVVATDPAGNESAGAELGWHVHTVRPTVVDLLGPPERTHLREATFQFDCHKDDVTDEVLLACTYDCRLDEGDWAPCASGVSFDDLDDGPHAFDVVARDVAGNESEPARWTFTVDTVAPEVVITEAPPPVTWEDPVVFAFACVDDPACSFACALERPGGESDDFEACGGSVTYADLALGPHVFRLRATDEAGNVRLVEHLFTREPRRWDRVSVGHSHSCRVRQDGSLWCWGQNYAGQLGSGDQEDRGDPVQVREPADETQTDSPRIAWEHVSVGGAHTCAIDDEDRLWCWGSGGSGRLGLGDGQSRNQPTAVGESTDWRWIAAGGSHTCGIRGEGWLYCWGSNTFGQVGVGNAQTPERVREAHDDWWWASAGDEHTCAIRGEGELYCWGNNGSGRLGSPNADGRLLGEEWRAVSAGGAHTCGIQGEGALYCWGASGDGRLGLGPVGDTHTPTAVESPGPEGWSTVSAGRFHTCATRDGEAWCWGSNWDRQVGDGTRELRLEPVRVGDFDDWAGIAAGQAHSCAARDGGAVYCWGDNQYGQVGLGTVGGNKAAPVSIAVPGEVARVGAGRDFGCAIDGDGAMWCWGHNYRGQVGDGTLDAKPVPVRVGEETDWIAVSVGWDHVCGIRDGGSGASGSLWCWGSNGSGELGVDSTAPYHTDPVRVGTGEDWWAVDAGSQVTCGLLGAGSLWCWGSNSYGQLAFGFAGGLEREPVHIGDADDWQAISVGDFGHLCGIREGGALYCWGFNDSGKLGDGSTTDRHAPFQIESGRTWAWVSAGYYHTCALDDGGAAWCWGFNAGGWLGTGDQDPRLVPTPVDTTETWRSIAAGGSQTCAVDDDGAPWCWGWNSQGQVGDGTFEGGRFRPVRVVGAGTVLEVSTGYGHSHAVDATGLGLSWGTSQHGALGDGSAFRAEPTRVTSP